MKHAKHSLASKIGVSGSRLSSKIAKIKREHPGISNKAAAGKAAGILGGKRASKVMKRHRSR